VYYEAGLGTTPYNCDVDEMVNVGLTTGIHVTILYFERFDNFGEFN